MKKEEMAAQAVREGSEEGPMGKWPRARLIQDPEAGLIVNVNGKWYVAVAGRRHDGSDRYVGLYARWVEIPTKESEGW